MSRPKPVRHRRVNGSKGPRFLERDFGEVPVQLLWDWRQRGVIGEPLYRAGCRFASEVRSMHEPCLSAMPLAKVRVDTSYRPTRHLQGGSCEASKAAVVEALEAVGGLDSRTASVLWHVVGMEWPLGRWCEHIGLKANGGDIRFAAGMLVSALEQLALRPAQIHALHEDA